MFVDRFSLTTYLFNIAYNNQYTVKPELTITSE